jgi:FtsP/CotA-like multicopper oxidase with cupredoxin domain
MPSDQQTPVFDRFLITLSLLGVAVVVLGVVAIATRPAAGAGGGEADTFVAGISLSEFKIDGDLTVPTGPVVLEVMNEGSTAHNLVLRDSTLRTTNLNPGETSQIDLGSLAVGTFQVFCDIPGHEAAGMSATITIAPEGSNIESTAGGHDKEIDWAALDDAMEQSMLAFPAETEGIGNQPLAPTVLADGTLEFELTASIEPWEVEPGKFVDAWTYNGQVPGPAIRVDVGDNVRIIVHNELPMSTDVHWHGIQTPNNMDGVAPYTQDLIRPGETFTYEFVAQRQSVGMYHAHHHGQMQVPNGMFGTFIIGDNPLPYGQTVSGTTIPEDLEIDLEIPMVLNDAGVIGLSLNGKSFPATQPYVVNEGDWVLIHYYNEGLQIHPMHLHQFPQLVYAKDGIPLDQPYWVDTLNVAPGERYSVLVNTVDPGTWVWHCHILTHVEREEGMFGMVTAFVVQES